MSQAKKLQKRNTSQEHVLLSHFSQRFNVHDNDTYKILIRVYSHVSGGKEASGLVFVEIHDLP